MYPLWEICKDPDTFMIYCSNTATQAEMHIRTIIYQLETNKKLIEDFAYQDPDTGVKSFRPPAAAAAKTSVWRDREIIIQRPTMSEHPTIYAVGAGGAVLGRRSKLIMLDDILDKDNSKTPDQREKIKYWHDNDLINTLEPTGRELVIGTPQDYKDLYADLAQRKRYKVRVDDAIVDEALKQTLWAERWSYDALMQIKEDIGSNYFNMQYRCVPTSDETTWFAYKWLADYCFDDEATLVDNNEGLKGFKIVVGVDLAISEAMGADYFIIFVLGIDPLGNHWCLHLTREKGLSFNAQVLKIEQVCNAFRPYVVFVEDNAYQKALYQELRRRTDVPVKAWTTTGLKKGDIDIGIRSLSVLVENGKLKIPRGDADSKRLTDIFVSELTDYGKAAHDDMVMAWWFAENAARIYLKEVRVAKSLV